MEKEKIEQLSALAAEDVFIALEASPGGLSAAEAEARQQRYGLNKLPRAASLSLGKLFLQQFTHMMALLLWTAGSLAFLVEMPELGWATWSVILINALFSFWQEYRADQAMSALAAMLPHNVKAYRGGQLCVLAAEQIVRGDLLVVEAGDHIPADCRLVAASDLMLDLSLLTGESLPVNFSEAAATAAERSEGGNLLFAGTTVTGGTGMAVVYAIGRQTRLGRVTELTAGVVRRKSSLELQVEKIVRIITITALSVGALVFLLTLGGGLDLRSSFIFCIGIIVALVPEGLLPVVSLSLAVGVRRMAQHNALVRKLSSVETLCATSIICTDKTGTITMNEVTVKRLWFFDGEAEISGSGYKRQGEVRVLTGTVQPLLDLLWRIGIVCSEADITLPEASAQQWSIVGDPTEAALLVAAAKQGHSVVDMRRQFKIRQMRPFNSHKKMMSVLCEDAAGVFGLPESKVWLVKGAPSAVLPLCQNVKNLKDVAPFTEDACAAAIAANDMLAREGYRVLAFAYGGADAGNGESKLIFVGLAAMIDPPRPEVPAAIAACRQAGIGVSILTGDYGLTAEAVARQIGLVQQQITILTGNELEQMDSAALQKLLAAGEPIVFSRISPEQKLQVVEAYKAAGHIVAVTGDGVNDAPALKAADIGIAMGRGGTDVAREVADIVLLDDNFSTIIKAIEQGRAIYDNIRKFITYILTANLSELMPFIAMVFLKIPPALNILQILAIDIGTDMVPALALGGEHPERGVLTRSPVAYAKPLLDQKLLLRAYSFLGCIEASLAMGAFFWAWNQSGYSLPDIQQASAMILDRTASPQLMAVYQHATTMALASIIACQMGNILVCRSEYQPFWHIPWKSNVLIFWGLGTELLIALALLYVPAVAAVFMTRPLGGMDLAVLAVCPVILIAAEELRRSMVRRLWPQNN